MPKYRINYTIERWYRIDVEAESAEQAREMFHTDKIDYFTSPTKEVGSELQDSVQIEELV
jgi:hypothetical protein